MGLLGILVALGLLIWLAYRGWSILLLAPAAALVASAFAREPLLAHWTQTFMGSAAQFLAQFFPLFLLGALFGKLMDDSGSVRAISRFMTERLGSRHAMLAVVLAGAMVTYGGVSFFVAFFVLAPMAQELFRAADIPRRLMPAAIALGTSTFTMSALPGTPSIQNAIPMPFFGTTPFAAPGLGIIASAIMLGFGMWWLRRAEAAARRAGEGYGGGAAGSPEAVAEDQFIRERATIAREFDPAELRHGHPSESLPPIALAVLPLVAVVGVNLLMAMFVLPQPRLFVPGGGAMGLDVAFGRGRRLVRRCGTGDGDCSSLFLQIADVFLRCARAWMRVRTPRSCRRSASQVSWASARSSRCFRRSMPCATGCCRSAAGPLVSLTVATNVLAALTGSASGGLTIALDALGDTYMRLAAEQGIDPALLHRVAVIGSGTLDSLPHNGAVVTLLAVCGVTHQRELSRHRRGGDRRRDHRARRGHRAGLDVRIVLSHSEQGSVADDQSSGASIRSA